MHMVDDRPSHLTVRERECLHLVAHGRSSKEIAASLGISPHTVDLHVKRAIKALGAASRRDAARMLEASEQPSDGFVRGLVTQSQNLAEPPAEVALSSHIRNERGFSFDLPFLRQGRQTNDLTAIQRLGWIGALALLLLLAVANFLNGLGILHSISG